MAIKVEPYWNVNIYLVALSHFLQRIKVEPYWNVNVNNLTIALFMSLY